MRRTLRIALLPLVISNYDCSVSALSVKSPLHMSNGDNSISSSRQVPTTSVLDSSRTSSPLGTFFPCPCSSLSLEVSRNETLWNDYFNRFHGEMKYLSSFSNAYLSISSLLWHFLKIFFTPIQKQRQKIKPPPFDEKANQRRNPKAPHWWIPHC